jgi:hypothetical protein
MQRKIRISIAAVAVLMLGILSVNLVMAATPARTSFQSTTAVKANVATEAENGVTISSEQAVDEEQLKKLIPATLEEAEASIYPMRRRFLMWTYDGVHVMWGFYGNDRFVGTDNLGKRCWGIYGSGIFAGFYGGEFFWGRYNNGAWKAQYLFGLKYSYGKYVVFPQPVVTSADVPQGMQPYSFFFWRNKVVLSVRLHDCQGKHCLYFSLRWYSAWRLNDSSGIEKRGLARSCVERGRLHSFPALLFSSKLLRFRGKEKR